MKRPSITTAIMGVFLIVAIIAWAIDHNKLQKKNGNRLGWCHAHWISDELKWQYIEYVKIKPWFHKKLLKHELTHWKINETSLNRAEASERNKAYDKRTKHNLLNYLPFNNDFDV